MEFTEEEVKIIAPFFTNIDKPIFVLKNLPEVVKGALFSRYSRTDKSLRKVLLDEFINKPEMGFKEIVGFQLDKGTDEIVAIKKAEEFYDRVLVGYGDDSVAELGGAHIACENVSNIASKVLEEGRIGLSPLEKSTRYVFFNEKVNGEYKYYREPVIMDSEFADLYVKICDMLFDAYSELIDPMKKFIMERHPMKEVSERAYNFTIKAKACDVLRVFLPASTLTNIGLYGNGRAFEYLLMKMYAHDLAEMRNTAASMHEELSKAIPSFVKRSNDKYGQESQKFIKETRSGLSGILKDLITENIQTSNDVSLIDYDSEERAEIKIATAIIYAYSKYPMNQIRKKVLPMSRDLRRKIISEYLQRRQNRRHKPGRAFENTYYTFDILCNYGSYRDLQRHRVLTQEKQDLTIEHGYDTPKELVEAGFGSKYHDCMQKVVEAFSEITRHYPKEVQYVVPFGFRVRWYFTLNLREMFHLLELRTMQQGHPDYRKICQNMFFELQKVHPFLAQFMKFIDLNQYDLERLESEKKLDKKIEEIAKKYDNN